MKNKEGRVRQVLEKSIGAETKFEQKFESEKKMDKSVSGPGQEEVKKSELETVRAKILSREIAKKRKDRPGLAEENLPHSWEGGGGGQHLGQHPQWGGGGAVHSLKTKIEIKQQENESIFVQNINKYKQNAKVTKLVEDLEMEERRTRIGVGGAMV